MSMQTETLKITGLREETLMALAEKAEAFGRTPEEYARELLEDSISSTSDDDDSLDQTAEEKQKLDSDAWMREWKALAQRISAAIPDGPSLVDTLIEMRR